MIAAKLTSDHSVTRVVKVPLPYVEFEIFYIDQEDILQRRRTTAKTLRSAISQAKVEPSTIVDASLKCDGEWVNVKLDDLDSVMGV
jgi:hypothetical protein